MGAWSTPSAGRRRGLEDSSRSRARCRASPPRPRGRDLDAPWSHRARRQRERSEVDLGVGGEAAADALQRKRAGSDLRSRRRKEEDLEDVARPHQHGGGIALRVRHYGPARLWIDGDAPWALSGFGPAGHFTRRRREAEHVVLLAHDQGVIAARVDGDRLRALAHAHGADAVERGLARELEDVDRVAVLGGDHDLVHPRPVVEGDSHRAGAGATAAVIVVATATTSGQCDGRQEHRAFRMVDVEEEHHTVVLVGHGQDAGDVAGHGDAGGTETDRYLANQRAERRSMTATAFSWASVTNATPVAWIATPTGPRPTRIVPRVVALSRSTTDTVRSLRLASTASARRESIATPNGWRPTCGVPTTESGGTDGVGGLPFAALESLESARDSGLLRRSGGGNGGEPKPQSGDEEQSAALPVRPSFDQSASNDLQSSPPELESRIQPSLAAIALDGDGAADDR